MNNLRFSTALHILVLLDYFNDEWLSSDVIAGSIGVNPVVVRKEIGTLRDAGFIACKRGKVGGYQLSKNAREILLSDIYRAVTPLNRGKYNETNPKCPIGLQMNTHLEQVFNTIESSISEELANQTLRSFRESFN